MAGEVVRECDTTALYTVILQVTFTILQQSVWLSVRLSKWGPMAGEVVRERDTTALYVWAVYLKWHSIATAPLLIGQDCNSIESLLSQITKEGSEVTKGQLKVTLEHFKTVVLAEWKAPMTGQTSTPLLLSLLASTNKSVSWWVGGYGARVRCEGTVRGYGARVRWGRVWWGRVRWGRVRQ